MTDPAHWDKRYSDGDAPWDTGLPSTELMRVVAEQKISPCRAVDLGCGTGANSVWLAQKGFDVTAVDISSLAIEAARKRATDAGVDVEFVCADVLDLPDLGEPFSFFFDRGCYHVVRRVDAVLYANEVHKILADNAIGLVLAGNAREKHEVGPPVVSEESLRQELNHRFLVEGVREFRFDSPPGSDEAFLAWSCLVRKQVD